MRLIVRLFAAVLLVLVVTGCSTTTSVSSSDSEADAASPIPSTDARALADHVAAALVEDDVAAVYKSMSQPFRDSTPLIGFDPSILYQASGEPLEAEYKMDEAGTTSMPWGQTPMRKYWYALRTTENEMGTFFLFVEVIENGSAVECSQFSVVSFAGEVPPQLQ